MGIMIQLDTSEAKISEQIQEALEEEEVDDDEVKLPLSEFVPEIEEDAQLIKRRVRPVIKNQNQVIMNQNPMMMKWSCNGEGSGGSRDK